MIMKGKMKIMITKMIMTTIRCEKIIKKIRMTTLLLQWCVSRHVQSQRRLGETLDRPPWMLTSSWGRYVMLCCVVLRYVMLCYVILCHVMLCCDISCYVIWYHIILYHIIFYHIILYHIIWYHIMLRYVM